MSVYFAMNFLLRSSCSSLALSSCLEPVVNRPLTDNSAEICPRVILSGRGKGTSSFSLSLKIKGTHSESQKLQTAFPN